VTLRFTRWRGALARAVPLVLISALIALPAAASEITPAPKAKNTQVSLRQAAVKQAAKTRLATGASARRAEQANTSKESTGFFRSGPGAVVLAVMVLGTGYAIYSAQHDRITSPAKK
jgi:hypothetical protein